jgi:hypothetical protein
MKRYALSVVLLLATPALATISQRQSPVSQWNTGATSTCFATLGSTPIATDLFVVWSFWTYTPPNQLTAKVTDSFGNTFVSAVGPTLQTTSNTYAQIFYVPNLSSPGMGSDKLTVTYYLNGTMTNANTSGCVFVEYQGADPNNPLDSVSEAVSNSGNPTSTLDSGTAAPANADLLVFGGGTSDTGPVTGSGTQIQRSPDLKSITEQTVVSGNTTLQRATAGIGLPGTGNWLMQMAIFRAASQTAALGSSSTRAHQILDASQFPGSDIGAQITAAHSALPSTGGRIRVPPNPAGGCWSYMTPITLNKPVVLEGDPYGSTCLTYTPTSGSAVTLGWTVTSDLFGGVGLRDLTIQGSCTTLPCSSGTAVCVQLGNGTKTGWSFFIENVSCGGYAGGVATSFWQGFVINTVWAFLGRFSHAASLGNQYGFYDNLGGSNKPGDRRDVPQFPEH